MSWGYVTRRLGGSGSFAIREVPECRDLRVTNPRRPPEKDLIGIGPAVVAVGELLGSGGSLWTIEIDDFVIGDWRALSNFVDGFDNSAGRHRYVLVNAMEEGRAIASPRRADTPSVPSDLGCSGHRRGEARHFARWGATEHPENETLIFAIGASYFGAVYCFSKASAPASFCCSNSGRMKR
jgi:hypothetical protein